MQVVAITGQDFYSIWLQGIFGNETLVLKYKLEDTQLQ